MAEQDPDRFAHYFAFLARAGLPATSPSEAALEVLFDSNAIAEAEASALEHLKARGLPESWAEVGLVFEDQYLAVLRDAVRFPSGRLGTYLRVLTKPFDGKGVVICPVHGDRLLLVRHYRHATGTWHWEFPRGFGEPGATAWENARRELKEEIQAQVLRLHLLGELRADTGLLGSSTEVVLAEIGQVGILDRDEGLDRMVWLSRPELDAWILGGKIDDGFTLAAWALARSSLCGAPGCPSPETETHTSDD